MSASRSGEWKALEAWRVALGSSLQEALSPETTVEFLTYRDMQVNSLRRFVVIYDGLTKTKIEVMYPDSINRTVARILEEINEHPD